MPIDQDFESVEINKHLETLVKTENTKHMHPSFNVMNLVRLPALAYYHIDKEASSAGEGNMDVVSMIGEDSPVRYIKIENFIMYGFIEDLHKRDRSDVTGYQMIKRGASYIIGGVFEPMERSFFKVTIDNQDYLYQITSVEPLQDKDKPIYRITHKVYVSDFNSKYQYIENQVSQRLMYAHENLGTEYKVLMDYDVYNSIIQRMDLTKYLQKAYIDSFYDNEMNVILCKDDGKYYYSDILVEFIRKTNCLRIKDRRVNIQLEHELITGDDFKNIFLDSPYSKILNEEEYDIPSIFSMIRYKKDENIFSPLNNLEEHIYNISLDPKRIREGSNFENDIMFTKTIEYTKESLMYKLMEDLKMDVTKLDPKLVKKYRIYSYDLEAYLYIPIVIFLLLNQTENDMAVRYNHLIADTLGAV